MKLTLPTLALTILLSNTLVAADWPTHLHDNRRSATTTEQLNAATLTQSWVFTSKSRPQPAWHGKMVRDSYAKRTFQSDSFDYDKAFNIIAADGKVFFGSTSANACIALNDNDGTELWRAPVGGAVRIAPTYDNGKVYFGSDDGQAYCVNAANGAKIWNYRGGPSATLIGNNHKFTSRFPCRTGVLVQGGKAYCGFGLLTWHGNYMCKLDATTGTEENKNLRNSTNYSFEGPLLADANNVYVPQGKNRPASFSLADVTYLGRFSGSGGTYATLTSDGRLFHGPSHNSSNRTDHMTESTASTRSKTSDHNYYNRIIVNGSTEYKLIRDAATATGGAPWTQAMENPVTIILGGTTLYVGARKKIMAIDTATGNVLKILTVDGDAYSLAIANGKLFASTSTGKIYCFN